MAKSRRVIRTALIGLAVAVSLPSCGSSDVATTRAPIATDNLTIPTFAYVPSSNELIPIEGDPDSYEVPELLSISLGLGTADPETTIREIADNHGGIVVGATPDLRCYEVHFAGYDKAALIAVSEAIEARPDVIRAHPYVMAVLSFDI